MNDIQSALDEMDAGAPQAAGRLLELVYRSLRELAARRLASEGAGHTLQPTALVHEAFLRVAGADGARSFANKAHFFGAAAEAMRRILIDHARSKKRLKRGGAVERMELVDQPIAFGDERLVDLDEALTRLAAEDAVAAQQK